MEEKINLTYRELAWQSERCRLLLDKLQNRFKNVIDCDHIVVYTFDCSHFVSSFRTVSLPKDMEFYKSELEKQYLAKLMEKQKNKENIENQGKNSKLASLFSYIYLQQQQKKRTQQTNRPTPIHIF
jgi:hypothetical protein